MEMPNSGPAARLGKGFWAAQGGQEGSCLCRGGSFHNRYWMGRTRGEEHPCGVEIQDISRPPLLSPEM